MFSCEFSEISKNTFSYTTPPVAEKHMWNIFLLYVAVEIRQLVNEISSFPNVLYEIGNLKNF